MKLVVMSVSL